MITAKVERASDPCGYVHLDFYGVGASNLKEGWEQICHEKFYKARPKINEYELSIKNSKRLIENFQKQLKKSKRWYRFWYTKSERELCSQIEEERALINIYTAEIAKLMDNAFYSTSLLRCKAEKYLRDLDFVLTESSCSGQYGSIVTEVWARD